jgi:hypothetical protein
MFTVFYIYIIKKNFLKFYPTFKINFIIFIHNNSNTEFLELGNLTNLLQLNFFYLNYILNINK